MSIKRLDYHLNKKDREMDDDSVVLTTLSPEQWDRILDLNIQGDLIEVASLGDLDTLKQYLLKFGIDLEHDAVTKPELDPIEKSMLAYLVQGGKDGVKGYLRTMGIYLPND
jgi:hypothetical protein